MSFPCFHGVWKENFGLGWVKRVTLHEEVTRLKRLEVQYPCNFASDALSISTVTVI